MGFSGFKYKTETGSPVRSLNGFYGFKIRIDVTSVKITDFRGRGLNNVKLVAQNPTSGIPFEGITNSVGDVYMRLDAATPITITKNQVVKTVQYNAEVSPTYTIDLPMIQNN